MFLYVLVLLAYNVNTIFLVFYMRFLLLYWMWRDWVFFFRVCCILLIAWTFVFVFLQVSMWTLPLGVFPHLFSFNATVSRPSSERVASNCMTVIEYSLRKDAEVLSLWIILERLRKTTKFLSQNSRSPGPGLNPVHQNAKLLSVDNGVRFFIWGLLISIVHTFLSFEKTATWSSHD
jgi:hypothetical protein